MNESSDVTWILATRKVASSDEVEAAVKSETSSDKSMIAGEVGWMATNVLSVLRVFSGGWGHQRLEEEKRREEQDRLRSQMQFDTYASTSGGLGVVGADVPRGEGHDEERTKRERTEDDDLDRRDEEEAKRFRGDRDEE